jgi:uncharacterized membrane protein
MNKQEFLNHLAARLASLPQSEIDKSIAYYVEMIDDRTEDGMTEEEAVAALGDIRSVAESIMYDLSIPALMKAKVSESKDRARNKGVWLTFVIIGFPVWFPLLMALAAVMLALYVSVWSIIISLYAVVISLGAACLAGVIGGLARLVITSAPLGICIIGAAVFCGALCLFLYKPVHLITKKLITFTADSMRKLKSLFIARNEVA